MSRIPRLRGREVVRALERVGFTVERIRGSHIFLKHSDGRATADQYIPVRRLGLA